jgi:uncharacterized metal-binding protein
LSDRRPSEQKSSIKTVLLYTCSGAVNVGEAADHACRHLTREGVGSMFCLASLSTELPDMVQKAQQADVNLVIDGCSNGCAQKVMQQAGLPNLRFLCATDLGLEKQPRAAPATDADVNTIVQHARQLLTDEQPTSP